jgi:hypothetical protein
MSVELRNMVWYRLGVLTVVLGLLLAGCNTTPEPAPLTEDETEIQITTPEPEPIVEPEPEPEPVVEPEPEPEPVVEPEPEPEPEPVMADHPEPIEVPEEVYVQTFSEVELVIQDLNDIIHRGDYHRWRSYLTDNYIEVMSRPEVLAEVSQSPVLRRNDIILRDLEAYFRYVVVPSRARSVLDELIFYSDTIVEALTERDEVLYLLYELRNVDGQWKLDIF